MVPVDLVVGSDLFKGLAAPELEKHAPLVNPHEYAGGTNPFHQDEHISTLYVVRGEDLRDQLQSIAGLWAGPTGTISPAAGVINGKCSVGRTTAGTGRFGPPVSALSLALKYGRRSDAPA